MYIETPDLTSASFSKLRWCSRFGRQQNTVTALPSSIVQHTSLNRHQLNGRIAASQATELRAIGISNHYMYLCTQGTQITKASYSANPSIKNLTGPQYLILTINHRNCRHHAFPRPRQHPCSRLALLERQCRNHNLREIPVGCDGRHSSRDQMDQRSRLCKFIYDISTSHRYSPLPRTGSLTAFQALQRLRPFPLGRPLLLDAPPANSRSLHKHNRWNRQYAVDSA